HTVGATLSIVLPTTTLQSTLSSSAAVDSQTTITVASAAAFPNISGASGQFVIQIGSEQLQVIGGQGTTSWTVTRGYNGTPVRAHSIGDTLSFVLGTTKLTLDSATSITVASASGFPTSGPFVIQVDAEQMLVTNAQGTTTWTVVQRGYNNTSTSTHTA